MALPKKPNKKSSKLTHIDQDGKASMVDVSDKQETKRIAIAQSKLIFSTDLLKESIQSKNNDIFSKKGSVFQTAILAGVMGSKQTANLIPLCHNILIDDCQVDIEITGDYEVTITTTATTVSKTGIEMEALTAASVAALTIYDMCKGADKGIRISDTKLILKTGGKSGDYKAT